jgi:hypothetical protein
LGYRKFGGIEINDKKNENFDIRGKFAGKSFDKRIFQTAIKGVLENFGAALVNMLRKTLDDVKFRSKTNS